MEQESKEILRNKKRLENLYREHSVYDTARILKVGINTVGRWLDRHKIERYGKPMLLGRGGVKRRELRFISKGYWYIKKPEWNKEKREHRVVVEEFLGRKLTKEETVHHIDGDKLNNKIENLHILNNAEHRKIEHELKQIGYILFKMGIIKFVDGHYVLDKEFQKLNKEEDNQNGKDIQKR